MKPNGFQCKKKKPKMDIKYEISLQSVGNRLREERQRLGLNQTELGDKVGMTRKTQILYESGERPFDVNYMLRAHQVGVDVMYVLFGIRQSEPQPNELNSDELELVKAWRAAGLEAKFVTMKVLKS